LGAAVSLEFQEYRPRRILNVHKHADGPWFWDRYSAHPYIGCRSGCEFCYLRGGRYLGKRDPDTFDTLIQVKLNAAELLRRELARVQPDVIACGDWQQPAEDRYGLSRAMLEVVLELGFPLFVVERSPLLTRDLDLLQQINQSAWVGVVYSMSNLDQELKLAFEPRSPGLRRRLQAMQQLAQAGILVGTSLMPVIPGVGDDRQHLEQTVQATRDHGGLFVLAGGLTMEGPQAERTLGALERLDPSQLSRWRELYRWEPGTKPDYGPPRGYASELGRTVRELCEKYGLRDRMPRYIPAGPLGINKRLAERLFLRTHDLELEQAANYRIWAYRKAAWTVDDWPEGLDQVYAQGGRQALRDLPDVGPRLADELADWITEA
jgi:DNA repair photolyase